ncbi:MAG: [NiFe]-hydrogenase assembly chaperone HybE [Magnetococcales bacterium]|nr:[NiFe]-hydrogenase assembly chaperone HybE [Magnetococcales bacterium]
MTENRWRVTTLADEALMAETAEQYRGILARHVTAEWCANEALPIATRFYRDDPPWRIFLLLTPWMLARLFFARECPDGLALPQSGKTVAEWTEEAELYQLGPVFSFVMHGQTQKAHLQSSAVLGHFLLQPLILNMEPYTCADGAFAAWSDTVVRRDALMASMKRHCGWQKEVSRRELFGRAPEIRSDRLSQPF